MLLCRNILVESFSLENGHSWQKKTFVEAEEHQESCLQIQDFLKKSFKYGSFYELLDVCLSLSSSPSFPSPNRNQFFLYWKSLWTTDDNFSALPKKQRLYN